MNATRVVSIGGGHGQSVVLKALRLLQIEEGRELTITGVVPHTDSGGSTGRIIKGTAMVPMGDWLKCLLALAGGLTASSNSIHDIVLAIAHHRFAEDLGSPALAGHAFGNFILAALLDMHKGNIKATLDDAQRLFGIHDRDHAQIWPVCERPATLVAWDVNGQRWEGEDIIDTKVDLVKTVPRELVRADLINSPPALPEVVEALKAADVIIFGPGDLFTSIIYKLVWFVKTVFG